MCFTGTAATTVRSRDERRTQRDTAVGGENFRPEMASRGQVKDVLWASECRQHTDTHDKKQRQNPRKLANFEMLTENLSESFLPIPQILHRREVPFARSLFVKPHFRTLSSSSSPVSGGECNLDALCIFFLFLFIDPSLGKKWEVHSRDLYDREAQYATLNIPLRECRKKRGNDAQLLDHMQPEI